MSRVVNREMETWVCNDCGHIVLKTRKHCHQCGGDEPNYDYLIESKTSSITGMARNPYRHHTDDS
jgi:hypothetical protein